MVIAFFAAQRRRAHRLAKFFFFPRQRIERFAFLARKRGHVVVKARNGHAEILVVQLGDRLRQNGDRIRNSAAENSRVQILRRPGDFDLIIIQAAQAVGDRRNALGQHGRVGNDQRIGLQPLAVLLHEIPQVDAADFFFAFDHHLHVDGQLPVRLLQRFQRLDVDVHLSLVVGRAAAEKIAVAHGGLEGGMVQRSSGSAGCTS